MIHQNANSNRPLKPASQADSSLRAHVNLEKPLVTLFSLPKPFECGSRESTLRNSNVDLIQRNAIKSWLQLSPVVDVILIGNEPGIAEAAAELGVRHFPDVKFNTHGTPLINSAFEIARRESISPMLAYCNCDVILTKAFADVIQTLHENENARQFVAIGKRIDLEVEELIEFSDHRQVQQLEDDAKSKGQVSSAVCKEYFIFNRDLYQNLPGFAVGRGNWDNWMIHSAKKSRVPVIDVSSRVTAIHQAHDYAHTGDGRYACYVSGDEARENMRLAGGRHLISGSTPTLKLSGNELKPVLPLLINPAFWADVPRFARLMFNLVKS